MGETLDLQSNENGSELTEGSANKIPSSVQDNSGEDKPPDKSADSGNAKKPTTGGGSNSTEFIGKKQEIDIQKKILGSSFRQTKSANQDASKATGYREQTTSHHRLPLEHLRHIESVFVSPKGFPDVIRSSDQRIFVIAGPEIPGTMTVSVKLALTLHKTYSERQYDNKNLMIFRYEHPGTEMFYTLNTIIKSSQFEENSIYILPRIFDLGLKRDELSQSLIRKYENELQQKNIYLIITATKIQLPSEFPSYGTDVQDKQKVYQNHLDSIFPQNLSSNERSQDIRNLFESLRDEIIQATPTQIGHLFERAKKEEDITDVDGLRELFFEVIDWYRLQHQWFADLNLNYKLFGILVALFQHMKLRIDLYDIEDLYFILVQQIRSTPGMDSEQAFVDPQRIGTQDLLDKLGISILQTAQTALQIPRFENPAVLKNILEQVSNHHRLLWVTENVLDNILDDPSSIPFDGAPAILAMLVGKIGIWRKRYLEKIISKHLAVIPDLAAYFITPLSQYPQQYDFMLGIIRSWMLDDDKSLQFDDPTIPFIATCQTINRVYNNVYEETNLLKNAINGRLQLKHSSQNALTYLRQMLTESVEACGRFENHIDVYRKQIENELRKAIDIIFDNLNFPLEKDALEELKSESFKEFYPLVNQELVKYMIRWTETSLQVLFDTIWSITEDYPQDMANLVRDWIERELSTSQDEEEELEAEKDIELLLEENEDSQFETDIERLLSHIDLRNKRVINNHVWRIAISAANRMFWSGKFTAHGQSEMPANDANDSALQEDTAAHIGEDSEIDSDNGSSQSTSNEVDDVQISSNDEETKSNNSNRLSLNSIEVERFLTPLLDLLPVMLKSSNRDLSIESFIGNLAIGDEMKKYFGKEGIGRFSKDIEILLTAPPIDVALFALQEWYNIVESNPESKKSWIAAVYPALLKLVTSSPSNLRQILRDALFTQQWIDSPHSDLRKIARAVIARAYVLDGTVVDLPLSRHGVILLDASNNTRRDYHKRAFEIAQRFSMLSPIHIYHMGINRISHSIGSESELNEIGKLINSSDLRLRRTYSRLVMPFFQSTNEDSQFFHNDPSQIHFVLILKPVQSIYQHSFSEDDHEQYDILDLPDLVDLATSNTVDELESTTWDPFATDSEKDNAQQNIKINEWSWQGKLILLSPNKPMLLHDLYSAITQKDFNPDEQNLNHFVNNLFKIVDINDWPINREDQRNIKRNIERQIIDTLHKLPQNEWWHNLERYRLLPDAVNTDEFSTVIKNLNEWVHQLDMVSDDVVHPRDISLTISWSILAISKQNLAIAIDVVMKWLESDDELENYMGIACTRVLFNFYRTKLIPATNSPLIYDVLLQLFPPLMRLDRGYSEFGEIIDTLLYAVQNVKWAERLIDMSEKSEFLEGIRLVSSKEDIRWILNTLTYSTNRLAKLESFCHSEAFQKNSAQTIHKLSLASQGITPNNLSLFEVYSQNLQRITDAVRLQLYTKLNGTLPPLSEGRRYGVIIIDIGSPSKAMSTTALAFIRNFHKQGKNHESIKDSVVLTVHHVGRGQVIFSDQRRYPKPRDLRPVGMHNNASLIGPILERYQQSQVGFALILASRPIRDLDDWADQKEWANVLWMHTPKRSWSLGLDQSISRKSVGKKHIDELTEDIILKIQ